jgi:hypothetical protein
VQTATSPVTAQRFEYDDDGNLVEGFVFGDLDNDGVIGQSDLGILMAAWGKCEGEAGYETGSDAMAPVCI